MSREDLKLLTTETTVTEERHPSAETQSDPDVRVRTLRLLVSSNDGEFPDDAA